MRRYIDEYLETPDREWLSPNFSEIKEKVLEMHMDGAGVDTIVKYLQDWMYIFDDEEEENWEREVVENIIEGKPVVNRWTKAEFE